MGKFHEREERALADKPLAIRQLDGTIIRARTRNLSSGGLSILSTHALPIGAIVTVALGSGKRVTAQVRWSLGRTSGLEILEASEKSLGEPKQQRQSHT